MNMKKKEKIFTMLCFVALAILIIIQGVALTSAEQQPTQQSNKIFLNPFYRTSMLSGTNYSYNVTISPPDKISSVISAIVSFDVYINPSTTFNLWVNNQLCNNPTYYISTTYASAGQSSISFDCNNVIDKAGVYEIILKPTQANTGAISGWIDLTYMNNPFGKIELAGTEYIANDNGKMFLQFLDSEGKAVNNSECFLSLWYPNDTTLYTNTLMSKLDNAIDGIYYKNFLVPNTDGVYPASAKCFLPLTFSTLFNASAVTENWESNSFIGGTGWGFNIGGSPPYSWDYYQATISSVGCYNGTFCVEYTGANGYIERGFNTPDGTPLVTITFAHKFSGFGATDIMEFWVWDGVWYKVAQYTTSTNTNGVWYVNSYNFSSSIYHLESLYLSFYTTSTGVSRKMYLDDFKVDYYYPNITISNSTGYQILRGAGEVHISKMYEQLNESISKVPSQIWNYSTRNLTYYPDVNISEINVNTSQIAQEVWNYNGTINNNILSQISNSIWTIFNTTNNFIDLITNSVWTRTDRNLTYYPPTSEVNYTLISDGVWQNINRSLTSFDFDVVNESLISQTIWAEINRTLTEFPDLVNETQIADAVWNSISKNLTYYEVNNISTQDIWNYANRNLTSEYINNLSAEEIWSYVNRTLTYYPTLTQIDLTNYTKIYEGVWNYQNRSLTYYQISNVTEQGIWEYINRSLTENIAQQVWTYQDRNLTYYEISNFTLSPQEVWDYANRTLTQDIPYEVWIYNNRTLTYYDVNNLSAVDIWNYINRTLTYYPSVNITIPDENASLIAQEVWNYGGTIHPNLLAQISNKILCVVQNLINQDNEQWGVDIC